MFANVICLVLLMCTLTIWSSVLCVLMAYGMFVVVNVMLYLMSVMNPPAALCNLSARTVVKLCTLGVFALGVSLFSWIVMLYACVSLISSLSSSSLFFISFMLTSVWWNFCHFTAGFVSLCFPCSQVVVFGLSLRLSWCPMWMRWLLRVWYVYCVCVACVYAETVWECKVDDNAGVGDGWGVVVVSAVHVGGIHGSGIVSSAADVLWMYN